jgi:hypothetical protein
MTGDADDDPPRAPDSGGAGRIAPKGRGAPETDREARLARQLRANLRRRKARTRAPADGEGDGSA